MAKRLTSKTPGSAHSVTKKRPAVASKAAPSKAGPADELPPTFVVNLARRPDRWKSVQQRLRKLGAKLSMERADAVDGAAGAEISTSIVTHTWSTASNWRYVTGTFEGGENCGYRRCSLKLTGGERGCAASHVVLWQRCAAITGAEHPWMILEDDAVPKPNFLTCLRQALVDLRHESPDILYLGYDQAAPWRRIVSKAVCEAQYLWTTVGYVLWPRGARKLLAELPVNQPVDNFMASLIASEKLRGFAITPKVVRQAKAWNTDNDVAHSDDVAWIQNHPGEVDPAE